VEVEKKENVEGGLAHQEAVARNEVGQEGVHQVRARAASRLAADHGGDALEQQQMTDPSDISGGEP
jgi:hypothetical protein